MRDYVATTDFDWFSFLRAKKPDEVNFWQPSGRGFHVLDPGEPLFKLKSPHNRRRPLGRRYLGGATAFTRSESVE